jgi:UDP-N-acetylmuramate dehydrogenase
LNSGALPGFVEREANLSARNTLALPGHAALYARIDAANQLQALAGDCLPDDTRRFVLCGGSTLVLTGDFAGLLLHMAIKGRQLAGEDADAWYVRAGAGENWHDFVDWTLAQGWPGLENLSLIPGTVGAAPIQNIGAYGLEVAERFHSLEACDMHRGETVRLDHGACRFGYRNSVFKQEGWHLEGRFVITHVTFRLPKVWQALTRYADVATEIDACNVATPNARQVADAVIAIRQRKLPDPARLPNAGSFFHNPVVDAATAEKLATEFPGLPRYPQADGRIKLAAGWLIEKAGWKGRDLGPVGMFEKQALVLVNHGKACGADVVALAQAVQADVRAKFAIELTPEPIFL